MRGATREAAELEAAGGRRAVVADGVRVLVELRIGDGAIWLAGPAALRRLTAS